MGVEPTKDCTTALPGFEVRTSHPGATLFQLSMLLFTISRAGKERRVSEYSMILFNG